MHTHTHRGARAEEIKSRKAQADQTGPIVGRRGADDEQRREGLKESSAKIDRSKGEGLTDCYWTCGLWTLDSILLQRCPPQKLTL